MKYKEKKKIKKGTKESAAFIIAKKTDLPSEILLQGNRLKMPFIS